MFSSYLNCLLDIGVIYALVTSAPSLSTPTTCETNSAAHFVVALIKVAYLSDVYIDSVVSGGVLLFIARHA